MELMEAIKTRRSIRKFSVRNVPTELVESVLESGLAAPSAGNLQARDFFVVTTADMREEFSRAAHDQTFIEEAPVTIVVCANLERIAPYGERGMTLYCLQDAAASIQNMLLMIHSLGLASCWVGAFNEEMVHEILKLPGHLRPVALLPIGYPAEKGKERKKRDDDVHWVN